MDDIKHKFLDLINKHQSRNLKIPEMGFTDNYTKKISTNSTTKTATTTSASVQKQQIDANGVANAFPINLCDDGDEIDDPNARRTPLIPDQEILDSIEDIYYDANADVGIYELNKFIEGDMDDEAVLCKKQQLEQQRKVISKKVLQNILEKRAPCDTEVVSIQETDRMLQQSLLECKKARSYLSCARKNLTTTNLQILATYKKREVLQQILATLQKLKKLKSTEIQLQKLLDTHNYSGAIHLVLECKRLAEENRQFVCVDALSQKLQDTLEQVDVQLENVLREIPQSFDAKNYSNLHEAFKLLGKPMIDHLHLNFISTIHTSAFNVLRDHVERNPDDKQKRMFEEICEDIPSEKFIPCLIKLCKSFWCILVCYYQAALWHKSAKSIKTFNTTAGAAADEEAQNEIVQNRFDKGYSRIWDEIQRKMSVYLSHTRKLHTLKYEQFIQVMSIIQRLCKVGMEFCNEPSAILMDTMKTQSTQFFQRYHLMCLDEIRLFLDNEAWMPVHSFSDLLQLQDFNAVKSSLQRFHRRKHRAAIAAKAFEANETIGQRLSPSKRAPIERKKSYENNLNAGIDDTMSLHSQEDCSSSVYGSCGYFLKFSEKSSPFDGGFDVAMLEEDILAGIADESSCYFSEESEEEQNQDATADTNADGANASKSNVTVNNSSLNVLRCIGRYLQMCKLLHSISPEIVKSMTELVDFYIYVVHEYFARDMPLSSENLYSPLLRTNLDRMSSDILPKVRNWSSSHTLVQGDLCDPEQLYGLLCRIVGIESAISLVQQFGQLRDYLEYLLGSNEHKVLTTFFIETPAYLVDLRKPIYMCVAARVIDLHSILAAMGKVKYDMNHVNVEVEHSDYITHINRGLQTFSMRLQEIEKTLSIPKEPIWDCVAHVVTHTLVEGYSNAKKCSAAGRALMQLDFTHCMSILELLSTNKYPHHHRYVDGYVKAYYMEKEMLEAWIIEERNKNNYSTKQFIALITCACVNDKKTRQKLLALLNQDAVQDLNDSRISDFGG